MFHEMLRLRTLFDLLAQIQTASCWHLVIFKDRRCISKRLSKHFCNSKHVIFLANIIQWLFCLGADFFLLSGLKPFLGHVGVGDLVHHYKCTDGRAECRQVPGIPTNWPGEPGWAEAQENAATAQQVCDESWRCMVAFEFGQGPALGQRVVDEGHCSHRLKSRHTHSEQPQKTMPRGKVRFIIQVFVVGDGCQAQDCTGRTETLQDPVDTAFGLMWKLFDGGAMWREEEYSFSHK